MAQLGLEWVVLQGTDWVDRGGKGYWTVDDIKPLQQRCRDHGLELYSLMIPIAWLMGPMLARDDRDSSIANIQRSIEAAAEAGVRMFEWRWSPDFNFSGDTGYYWVEGRGGSPSTRPSTTPAWPTPRRSRTFGAIPRQELWDRMVYFAERVDPGRGEGRRQDGLPPQGPAGEGHARHRAHPHQHGSDRRAYLDVVDSPAHGFTFCQGTVTEMGVDVLDAIRRVGERGRIHHVHFRTVRGTVPKFVETFIDNGDIDMLQAMRAYHEVDYQGSLVSDHTPGIVNDFANRRVGRTYSARLHPGPRPDRERRPRSRTQTPATASSSPRACAISPTTRSRSSSNSASSTSSCQRA